MKNICLSIFFVFLSFAAYSAAFASGERVNNPKQQSRIKKLSQTDKILKDKAQKPLIQQKNPNKISRKSPGMGLTLLLVGLLGLAFLALGWIFYKSVISIVLFILGGILFASAFLFFLLILIIISKWNNRKN